MLGFAKKGEKNVNFGETWKSRDSADLVVYSPFRQSHLLWLERGFNLIQNV